MRASTRCGQETGSSSRTDVGQIAGSGVLRGTLSTPLQGWLYTSVRLSEAKSRRDPGQL